MGMGLRLVSGNRSGEGSSGTGATFEVARCRFEGARRAFLPTRTEADLQAWRNDREGTAWKYAIWAAGLEDADATSRRKATFAFVAQRSISEARTGTSAKLIEDRWPHVFKGRSAAV
jgi:hypothetical protein